MIDYFALAISHALLLVALLRLVKRGDVDTDPEIAIEQDDGTAPKETRREARERRRRRNA